MLLKCILGCVDFIQENLCVVLRIEANIKPATIRFTGEGVLRLLQHRFSEGRDVFVFHFEFNGYDVHFQALLFVYLYNIFLGPETRAGMIAFVHIHTR